ncbi:hypothetical protein [Streptomyces caatingaensis]|uniref:Lipoprotein n=1 Tax=Streptomyces caatingaensis TaxID=1678637 RepID=A0A0K9XBP4_9ACTN|nr:hypothetical protein [Streptomyces caatingaensis]KNB50628.1 hypothetical protein AC230_22145 [Streptomyces caatingaensis]
MDLRRITHRAARTAAAGLLLGLVTACGGSASPTEAAAPPATTAATAAPVPKSTPKTTPDEPAPHASSAGSPAAPLAAEEGAGSPERHPGKDGPLALDSERAHATKNCAKIPGKKKGSCNEPHRKCRQAGATAVSSHGIRLTCRIAPWDGRLRWLADGE